MKLERISAAAQIELPNAKPLNRSQSISKTNAPRPEKNRTPQRTATRELCDFTACDACLERDTWDFRDLVNITRAVFSITTPTTPAKREPTIWRQIVRR